MIDCTEIPERECLLTGGRILMRGVYGQKGRSIADNEKRMGCTDVQIFWQS